MAKTVFLKYTIWLTDKDQLAALVGAPGSSASVNKAPAAAAVDYSAPLLLGTAPFKGPCITSEWFTRTDENFPTDEADFIRCQGGWFGVCFLFGTRTRYVWRGTFELAPEANGTDSPIGDEAPVACAQRRWIDGFELAAGGEGSTGTTNARIGHGSSRHLGGMGMKIDSAGGGVIHGHAPAEASVVSNEQWERFYWRFRRFPVAARRLWQAAGISGTNNNFEIWVLPSGALSFYNTYSTGSDLLGTTQPIAVGEWKKIDVLYRMALGSATLKPFFRVYINGSSVCDAGAQTSGPLNFTTNIGVSTMGTVDANTLIVDLDDWIGSALPQPGNTTRTGTTTIGSPTVTTITDTAQILAGDLVSGAGIPAGTTVINVVGPTSITLSANATAAGAVPLTFTRASVFPGYDWNHGSRVVLIGASQGESSLQGTLTLASPIVTGLPNTGGLVAGMTVTGLPPVPGPTPAEDASYVAAVKAALVALAVDLSGPCGAFQITKRVAWGLRHVGAGLLDKPSGNNCSGYAVDIIMFPDGHGVNILTDAGGTNGPVWDLGVVIDDGVARYRIPINPGDGGTTSTTTILTVDSPTQVTLNANANQAGPWLLTFASASGFAADQGTWAGDWRLTRQRPIDTQALTALTSTIANAKLSIRTDAAREIDGVPAVLGIVAMRIACYGMRAGGAVAGALGYKLPGGADVTTPVTQAGALGWVGMSYLPSTLIAPLTPLAGLEIKFIKDSGVSLSTVRSLLACAEAIGDFGTEDLVPHTGDPVAPVALPAPIGVHNTPYPHTPWAKKGVAPISPLLIYGGLYTGNATFVDLAFRHPIHFLWIRPVAGGAGVFWIASANAPHPSLFRGYDPRGPVEVLINPAFMSNGVEDGQELQTLARIVGDGAPSNANAAIYQVFAIGDPGMRFFAAGALTTTNSAGDLVTTMDSPTFTPEACFVIQEQAGDNATTGVHYKGIGHAAAAISPLTAAEIASGLSMSLGALTYKSGLLQANLGQIAYLACRRNDLSADPGIPRVLQLATYTGDGSASRTIGLAVSGRRPMFAIVVPHNAAAIQRDPSHTGTTSTVLPATSNAATGITGGGIDSITVGSLLNANGIVYDIFCIPGTVEACNNGWSCNGDIDPVEPVGPIDIGPWDPEPEDPTIPVEPPLVPPGPGGPDFGVECKPFSTVIINQALSKIGVSQPIGDVLTEASPAADQARLHYSDVVTQVLRDFPWPFATKYQTLALVGGSSSTPLNPDWRYSYRRPSDCVFERRLAVPRTAALDPTPPPFQLSSDTTGGLLLTNRVAAVLEYTYRPTCSASAGDPLFREALIWKLAGALAPALSRMVDIVKHCESSYQEALVKATMIIRPGNPGEEPTAGTLDLAAAHALANVAVVNRALVRIGARTIPNLASDQSREAVAARAIFEAELRATLRDHPWAAATAYSTLTLVAGTTTVAVNGDWQYSYRVPADVVFVRRIVTLSKRAFQVDPPAFRLSRDATGALLFTDQVTPVTVETTVRNDGAVYQADDIFRDALAWRLAASLAPSLALIDPARIEQEGRGPDYTQKDPPRVTQNQRAQTARWAWAMYLNALARATVGDAREQQQPHDDHDADWISGRN